MADQTFEQAMHAGYTPGEPSLVFGSPMLDGAVLPSVRIQVGLSMLNRHGLIAGATGTGKTKTLQLMAGQLSEAGVPVFVADVKGDLTGLAAPGDAANPKLQSRVDQLAWPFVPMGHPVEFLSLSGARGAQVRATVSSFGPLLLGKILDLNETQTSVLSLVFKYCDDNDLPLLDLADLSTTLRFLASDQGAPIIAEYGGMAPATLGVIMRSIVTLEQAGADPFFGEPEFDVDDLIRLMPDGKGVITVLELADVMDKPRLFSTFMLWMLAQLYHDLPEVGDLPKPKLCFFFDEAHLLFDDASEALLDQIEQTARLIRSKGVGVYFVTQAPTDVPASVLSQLGNRVQHALRAFTPDDADNLRKTARTFPMSDFYDVEETLTSLGIGEAFVTVLSPRGIPTPLAATLLVPPDSLMAALDPAVFADRVATGFLRPRYADPVDRVSAHEIISGRLAAAREAAAAATAALGAHPAGTDATTGVGLTPAQQQREINRRVREIDEARREAERLARTEERARAAAAREAERERRAAQRAAQAEARRREREMAQVTRIGSDLIRGVFGTLLGGRTYRSRRRR